MRSKVIGFDGFNCDLCSYDAKLRVFDRRSWRRELDSLDLEGGVWRLCWHPRRSDLLAVAAMHAGFAVVERGTDGKYAVKSRYGERNDSLAYGVGWQKECCGSFSKDDVDPPACSLLTTCSFYDRCLQLSRFADTVVSE
jgi:diphthamide biosynthesis protein 7